MTLDSLFETVDQLVDVPGAIDSLRELVLQYAVRGRLASQWTTESVNAQLKKVQAVRASTKGKHKDLSPQAPFEVPRSWSWVAIGDAMELINGRAFKPEEWTKEGTPIIRIQNLNNESAPFNRYQLDLDPKVHVNNGDLLISWSGTPGTSFGAFIWNRGFAYLNQHIFRCEVIEGLFDKAYLRLAINARLDEMISRAHGGVGLRHITKGNLERISLPLPPLSEQKRIVSKVEELVALCDRLEVLQNEREVRQFALSRAACARFEEHSSPANLSVLFQDAYSISPANLRKTILNLAVQGKLVPIGDTGKAQLVGDHVEFLNGFAFKSEWFKPQGVRLCRNINVAHGTLNWKEPAHVDEAIAKELGRFALQEGDVLLSLDRPLINSGLKVARVRQIDLPCLLLQRVAKVVPKHDGLELSYFFLWLNSPAFVDSIDPGRSNGVPHISTRHVEQLPFVLPTRSEQLAIVAITNRLMALVDQLEHLVATKKRHASALLTAAINELLDGVPAFAPLPTSSREPGSDRAAIGCYALQQLTPNPSFGRTMLMKVCYLSEVHLGIPLGWQPIRQAAGPYDPEIETFELSGQRNNWFTVAERPLSNGHNKVEYHASAGLKAKVAQAVTLLGDRKSEFDRLLSLFQNKTTEEAEIIATLFAAWNDLLIDGKSPSDDEIIREVRENWHYKKERFTPTLLTRWLNWLRQQSVTPRGLAPRTRQQLKLGLS
jgi:type I restriction enzyme S subunit